MNIEKINGAADKERFVEAYDRIFNCPGNLKFLSYTGIPFSRAQIADWADSAKHAGVEYYAAAEEGVIAGILVVRHNAIESYEILAVAVDPRFQGRGAGRMLLDAGIEIAKDKGFKAVDIVVFADNQRMLTLVIRHGFKPVCMEYRKRFDGEDALHLKKYL